MAKKPKLAWQVMARSKLDEMGIGYKELAEQIGTPEGTVRQVMCKNVSPGVRSKICKHLNIEESEKEGA